MNHIYRTDPESFHELAEILKVLAHPQRLCIIKTLCEKDRVNVGDMQHCLDEAQSTVSQHLSKLKARKLIVGKREGTSVYYSISDERVRNLVQAVINEFFSDKE